MASYQQSAMAAPLADITRLLQMGSGCALGIILKEPEAGLFLSSLREISPEQRKLIVSFRRAKRKANDELVALDDDDSRLALVGVGFSVLGAPAFAFLPCHVLLPDAIGLLRNILTEPTSPAIVFNLQLVLRHLTRAGLSLQATAVHALDPSLMAWLFDPSHATTTLSAVASNHGLHLLNASRGLAVADAQALDIAVAQLKADLSASAALCGLLAPRLSALGLLPALKTEMMVAPLLACMEATGIGVDTTALADLGQKLSARARSIADAGRACIGVTSFNIGSNAQVADALYAKLGLPLPTVAARWRPTTAQPLHSSTAEAALMELRRLHGATTPLPGLVLQYRAVVKLLATWVTPLPRLAVGSRIHARWLHTAAATGRIASAAPNLQAVPKLSTTDGDDSETAALLRTVNLRCIFIAPPGTLLLSADYGQVELRVLASLSGDVALSGVLSRTDGGGDVFRLIAAQIGGGTAASVTKEQREKVKRSVYALIYGQGSQALGMTLGIDARAAHALMSSFRRAYPSVPRFEQKVIAEARRCGYIKTWLGRVRRLPDINSSSDEIRARSERQAINSVIQGTAADIFKRALIAWNRGAIALRAPGVATAHDELIVQVPCADLREAASRLRAVLISAGSGLSVRLTVNLSAGQSWGTLEPLTL